LPFARIPLLRARHLCIYPTCPQIVPTEYTTRLGTLLETSQYSVSEYAMPLLPPGETGRHGRRDPFVDLVYDLSPIVMRIHQSPLSLAHFVVRLCAVVGGALSVTRLADGLVHGVVRALGLSQEGRRVSSGGGRSSTGGGSVHSAAYCGDGLLPTRSSNPGSSHRSSLGGSLSGFVGALARHNSGGSGGGGGSSSIAGRLSGGGEGRQQRVDVTAEWLCTPGVVGLWQLEPAGRRRAAQQKALTMPMTRALCACVHSISGRPPSFGPTTPGPTTPGCRPWGPEQCAPLGGGGGEAWCERRADACNPIPVARIFWDGLRSGGLRIRDSAYLHSRG
jgi:hypothetical protein